MIIPAKNETLVYLYRCPRCRGIYQEPAGDMHIRCGVVHSPGSCCHYGEKGLTEEMFLQIQQLLVEATHGTVPEQKTITVHWMSPGPVTSVTQVMINGEPWPPPQEPQP